MKRSEINAALRELEAMCKKYSCFLPPFCHFTPDEWKTKGHEYDEIRDCMLGWDITDFGLVRSQSLYPTELPARTALSQRHTIVAQSGTIIRNRE